MMMALDLEIIVDVQTNISWWTTLKLRLAGREFRVAMLDELRLKLTEALVLRRQHPENDL